jgi:capsular polysaccharide transport system permease protein
MKMQRIMRPKQGQTQRIKRAGEAWMRKRHWLVMLSFIWLVLAPLFLTGWYLIVQARDQYASVAGFTIRQEGAGASAQLIGMAAQLGATGGPADTDILYEFIQSRALVEHIDQRFDLRALYTPHHSRDPIFALHPEATPEDLVDYWPRIVRLSYDQASHLMELEVRAFAPETAQYIAREILARSQQLINDLNAQARKDALGYAQNDLAEAQTRLRSARTALVLFRTRTGLVDLESDLQGRLGVVNTLQQQLAEALIEFDMLSQSTKSSDSRVRQAKHRIDVIRARINEERRTVARGATSASGEDYPTLLAEYESLLADREFAEENYRAALVALDLARANASRQSSYLAIYVPPTLPYSAEYPQRITLFALAALFLTLGWSILILIYYAIRDSR